MLNSRFKLSTLGYLLLALAFLAFNIDKMVGRKKERAEGNFAALRVFEKACAKGGEIPSELIDTAEKALSHHPELAPRYEGLITLALIQQGREKEASQMTSHSRERLKSILAPSLFAFAEISQHLEEGDLDSVKKEMQAFNTPYQSLHLLNQIRYSLVSQNKEEAIWSQFAQSTLSSLFLKNSFTLVDLLD